MNNHLTPATPYELAILAAILYLSEHRPGDPPDDLPVTSYLPTALTLLKASEEFLKARVREEETK